MRIIAGKWRSRQLMRPRSSDTRPMPDRVKESIFNMLCARYGLPGDLPPLRVADVFAGSGSMGLEALSRGALRCWFFERDPMTLKALRQNIQRFHAGNDACIATANAWRYATHTTDDQPFDLIFLDPPYRDSDDPSESGAVATYLGRLTRHADCEQIVVLHHRATVSFHTGADSDWTVVEDRTIGSNRITFFCR